MGDGSGTVVERKLMLSPRGLKSRVPIHSGGWAGAGDGSGIQLGGSPMVEM